MKSICSTALFITLLGSVIGQGNRNDHYYEIPDSPKKYTAGTVAARVVDGLGFRYYWATEGLRAEDLAFKPSEEARTIEETINHIVVLVGILSNAVDQKPFNGIDIEGMSYEDKRKLTLSSIRMSSERLKESTPDDLMKYDMIFSSGTEYPFWNLLNGPIADAINHVGQIISLRRTNGNPYNQNISVLSGKVKG
ncbi:DinB family protein [Ekhidna sp.]